MPVSCEGNCVLPAVVGHTKKMFQDNLKKNTQQSANGQNKGNVSMSNELPDTMTGLGCL